MAREGSTGVALERFEFSSTLDAPAELVWSHAIDFRQINRELMPVLRMTVPAGWRVLSPDRIRPGQKLFRSWLLLFGVVPVDYDDLTFAEVGPDRRFLERSRMMSAAVWEHERFVQAIDTNRCRVTDRVAFAPRWRPVGLVLRWVVPRVFAHRHRRLRARFGSSTEH